MFQSLLRERALAGTSIVITYCNNELNKQRPLTSKTNKSISIYLFLLSLVKEIVC